MVTGMLAKGHPVLDFNYVAILHHVHACLTARLSMPLLCPCDCLPADLHGNFVRQFWRFQAKSKDVKGLKYLSPAKVAGDNIVWTSYAVYTDFEGLIKHAR
jgi:hypothetical protein